MTEWKLMQKQASDRFPLWVNRAGLVVLSFSSLPWRFETADAEQCIFAVGSRIAR
jgi:hypothetical protein